MAFYCVTKSREPTTNESDVFSAFTCTLFVSVNDKLLWILPYQRKTKVLDDFAKNPLAYDLTEMVPDDSMREMAQVCENLYKELCE